MNMTGLLIKQCTKRHDCAWADRCAIALDRRGALPITPQHTADGCDWFEEIKPQWGSGKDTEEND